MDTETRSRFHTEDQRHHDIQEELKKIHQKLDIITKRVAAIEPMTYESSMRQSSVE